MTIVNLRPVASTTPRQKAGATATLNRLRNDLERCVSQADKLGLSAIAIYLKRAADELESLSR